MTHFQVNASSLENGEQEIEKTNKKKKKEPTAFSFSRLLTCHFHPFLSTRNQQLHEFFHSISQNPETKNRNKKRFVGERYCNAKDTDAVPASMDGIRK
ncbi:hypothetical protein EUGRSUZ_C00653 [Eucalyptus grandis]|uniref:Uncharacterized protein n=2 Tax=Eucalyptus grandis TaxID=71139 RepID=A0ACC3LCJ5_EUCGR|nr:hypothetical protein EUGRSUZ_C00653 [Eucalyptus grandis]